MAASLGAHQTSTYPLINLCSISHVNEYRPTSPGPGRNQAVGMYIF
jgi:hypothetical protein